MFERADNVLAHMEQLGAQTVRDMTSSGRWPANYHALAKAWLHKKDAEEREQKEAHRAEAVVVAQRSNELARSATNAAQKAQDIARSAEGAAVEVIKFAEGASVAAQEANSIARSAARTAQNSSTIAILALIAGAIAIAISIIGVFVTRQAVGQ